MQIFLKNSRLKQLVMIPIALLLLIVVPLLMAGWIYEGPRRLVVKVLKKGRKERI